MSLVSIATLTYDTLRFAEFEDFPETSEPVWILGRKYSVLTGTALPSCPPLLQKAAWWSVVCDFPRHRPGRLLPCVHVPSLIL